MVKILEVTFLDQTVEKETLRNGMLKRTCFSTGDVYLIHTKRDFYVVKKTRYGWK